MRQSILQLLHFLMMPLIVSKGSLQSLQGMVQISKICYSVSMLINPSYIFMPRKEKINALLSFAMQDAYFEPIIHDLIDYGHDINFSFLGGAGAYQPFALSTEQIDTPEKQQQFSNGFWAMSEAGNLKAKIKLSLLLGQEGNIHSCLHELMHFYQDISGLYLSPLKEQGVLPIMLNLRSQIAALLFCEAWAQTEAIRTCWALREDGDKRGWMGATSSPDWKELALGYDKDMQGGTDEKVAAAAVFKRWYKGDHRSFYERHAMRCYDMDFARLTEDVQDVSDENAAQKMIDLELPMLIARVAEDRVPKYFSQIDWHDDLVTQPQDKHVLASVKAFEDKYGVSENYDVQQIKCGSPPYLWKRLREVEITTSEVPPH